MSERGLKEACALARALMPLEIEGVASEESARYVKEHIAGCTDCAVAYGEEKQRQRQATLEAAAQEGEQFRREMRRMKRRWMLRLALSVAGAIALALALFTGGFGLKTFLSDVYQFYVPLDEYDLTLYRLEDGRIVAQYDFAGEPFDTGLSFRLEEGEMRLFSMTTAIRHPLTEAHPLTELSCRWEDGRIYATYPGWDGEEIVLSISVTNGRRGNGMQEKVIWTQGQDIPLYAERRE